MSANINVMPTISRLIYMACWHNNNNVDCIIVKLKIATFNTSTIKKNNDDLNYCDHSVSWAVQTAAAWNVESVVDYTQRLTGMTSSRTVATFNCDKQGSSRR